MAVAVGVQVAHDMFQEERGVGDVVKIAGPCNERLPQVVCEWVRDEMKARWLSDTVLIRLLFLEQVASFE